MPAPLLLSKLYIPPPRPGIVPRPRLIERLNEGLHRKLTLISAPAGFGKTTLLSEWIAALLSYPSPISTPAGFGKTPITSSPLPVGRGVRGEGSLAVAGRIGQRPGAFQHLSDRGVTDNRSEYWRRSIGSPPIPSAALHRNDPDHPAQRDFRHPRAPCPDPG